MGSLSGKWKLVPNGASSSQSYKIEKQAQETPISPTWSSLSGDEYRASVGTGNLRFEGSPAWSSPNRNDYQIPPLTQNLQRSESRQDDLSCQEEAPSGDPLEARINRRLEERWGSMRQRGDMCICMFRFPPNLAGIDSCEYHPEIVSIGPYHRGKDQVLEFEEHKWSFLDRFLSRTGFSVSELLAQFRIWEEEARDCYSDDVLLSSHDFVEMMLLDSCFILELLRHLNHSGDVIQEDDPIFTRPWLIPIIIKDLLKLENQLPYFVIHSLFHRSGGNADIKPSADPLPLLVLKTFDLAFSRPPAVLERFQDWRGKHLLELFHFSLRPSSQISINIDLEEYHPSDQSIQCVTQLRPAGLKFKTRKADSFLDINFRNRELQIPPITINDVTSTILINCVALEQCEERQSNYITDYVAFMSCLINQPRDVAFLCSDGIITRFSKDDQYVASLFNNLGKNVAFNIRRCYLSKQFKGVESYYSGYWATIRRTYFSSPWSFISVLYAFILLLLTLVQTIMSILSYKCQGR